MRLLPARLPFLALLTCVVAALWAAPVARGITLPPGFETEVIASGFGGSIVVDWTPDGRMLVGTAAGNLVVVNPGSNSANATIKLAPGTGPIYGLAVDAQFAQNGFVYIARQVGTSLHASEVVTRVKLLPSNTLEGGETVILGTLASCLAPKAEQGCMDGRGEHDIGALRFDQSDNSLYVANGDNQGAGYHPGSINAQDENHLAGKILHIDRNGKGLPSHPFCKAETNLNRVCTKVAAKGFRNPFSLHFRPNGSIIGGHVGHVQRESLFILKPGGNFGWPCYEGTVRTANWNVDPKCAPIYALEGTPNAPIRPIYEYPHAPNVAVIAGPTYRGGTYPADFNGNAFFADYGQQWIKRLVFDAADKVVAVKDFATNATGLVNLALTPQGDLAYVDLGARIVRIRSTTTNRAPTAVATATPREGTAPLSVRFNGAGSSDPDRDALRFAWNFGDGTPAGTTANPVHVYSRNGTFTARLTVTDTKGATAFADVIVNVGNTAPTVTVTAPPTFRIGTSVTISGSATDKEDGALPATRLSWDVALVHGEHVHDAATTVGRSVTFVPLTGHDADSFYRVTLTATDSGGGKTVKTVEIRPQTIQLTLASNPPGAELTYDGLPIVAPQTITTAIGFTTGLSAPDRFVTGGKAYQFVGWSDGGAALHQFVVPATATRLEARYALSTAPAPARIEGEAMDGVTATGRVRPFPDSAASGGAVASMLQAATISKRISSSGATRMTVVARADECGGVPTMLISIDGKQITKGTVPAGSATTLSVPIDLPAGDHTISVQYLGDLKTTLCDRNLHIDRIDLTVGERAPSVGSAALSAVEMESLPGVSPLGFARKYANAAASGGNAVRFHAAGELSLLPTFGTQIRSLLVHANGERCDGDAVMVLRRSNEELLRVTVPPGASFRDVLVGVALPPGTQHWLRVSYLTDRQTTLCDRNLLVDDLQFFGTRPAVGP